MNALERNEEEGLLRQRIVHDILASIHEKERPISVYTYNIIYNSKYWSNPLYSKYCIRCYSKYADYLGNFYAKCSRHVGDYVPVFKFVHQHNLLGKGKHFSFYVLREGYTIISKEGRKGPDILVYKNGKLMSVWEITNYAQSSYMGFSRLYRYIKNLTNFDCKRVLVVSYRENFRRVHPDKTEEYNIEWTEKTLAKNKIFPVYMGYKDILPEKEISGWIEE
jgi:hypothetical protein